MGVVAPALALAERWETRLRSGALSATAPPLKGTPSPYESIEDFIPESPLPRSDVERGLSNGTSERGLFV